VIAIADFGLRIADWDGVVAWVLMAGAGAGAAVTVWCAVLAAKRGDEAMERFFDEQGRLLDPSTINSQPSTNLSGPVPADTQPRQMPSRSDRARVSVSCGSSCGRGRPHSDLVPLLVLNGGVR
jgi:hypothetical protein